MLARIGKVAYKLVLPGHSKILPVFHVSQLKQVVGAADVVTPLPPTLSDTDDLVVEPDTILDRRYDDQGFLEMLVK